MKSIHFKSFLAFLLILSATVACKKEYEFPDITQEGKGTFGCIIDGKKYVPEDYARPFSPSVIRTTLSALEGGEYYKLRILVTDDKTKTFGNFVIEYRGNFEDLHAGTYNVTDPKKVSGEFSAENNRGHFLQERYSTAENTEGTVTILKYDKKAKVISGTFEFPMFHNENGKRIEVTEGRFDLKID